ncbi:MAG TPA: beta-phosphoglucomutase [Kiritimatiellia bacterium]|nr:beta-phosphoglucomutase [Kiritimatiellia bacterium]
MKDSGFRGALFDLDGVLVDTAEHHYLAWRVIADELGVPLSREKNERLRGVPRMASLEILVEDMGTKPTGLEALADRKNRLYVERVAGLTPADALPGARELLESLRAAGVRVGLGSSSRNARAVLQRLDIERYFDAIVDGHAVQRAKPDPEVFVRGARLLGLEPSACVVVEDAPAGIEAAVAAGAYPVAIVRGGVMPGARLNVHSVGDIPLSLWCGVQPPAKALR